MKLYLLKRVLINYAFSSLPEHKVLKMSFCACLFFFINHQLLPCKHSTSYILHPIFMKVYQNIPLHQMLDNQNWANFCFSSLKICQNICPNDIWVKYKYGSETRSLGQIEGKFC